VKHKDLLEVTDNISPTRFKTKGLNVQNMMFLLLFFGGGSTIVSILLNCRGRDCTIVALTSTFVIITETSYFAH
jgi:hypothetical protein